MVHIPIYPDINLYAWIEFSSSLHIKFLVQFVLKFVYYIVFMGTIFFPFQLLGTGGQYMEKLMSFYIYSLSNHLIILCSNSSSL